MSKQEGEDLMRTLVSAFRDTNLGIHRYRGVPFVQDETAESYLVRIMDFWDTEMWDDTSTNAISKEVILTLFQCAARLYESKVHAKAAVDLIESNHTRQILSLGIQDVLCRIVYQRCIESTRSDEFKNVENYYQRAGLFSAIRKNKARQLNYQAMIFEHITSLCRAHGAALQNAFDSPGINEQFMFYNYTTLSKAFNRHEKSWLVTLLPDTFQWDGWESQDGDIQPFLGQAAAKEQGEWWGTSWESGIGNLDLDPESFVLTNKILELEKWIDLRKKAVNYPKSTLVGAATSEFHDQATPQKAERTPVSIDIERGNIRDYHKELKAGIPDSGRNLPRSDGDGENIFPFSPDARHNAANGRLMSTLLYNVDNEHSDRVPSVKDAYLTLPSVVAPSLKLTREDSQQWLNVSEPSE
ncbi:hypothetical protein BGZ60DRAFT_429804 [Tricladium varicosporioides]|nr:hypothetical protein BGZ60DRAFT_429804 [Hymenoscyphus varicosporioides]